MCFLEDALCPESSVRLVALRTRRIALVMARFPTSKAYSRRCVDAQAEDYDVDDVRVSIECASCLRDVHQRGVVEYCVRSQAGVEGFDGEKAAIGKGGQTEEHLEFACAISTYMRCGSQ